MNPSMDSSRGPQPLSGVAGCVPATLERCGLRVEPVGPAEWRLHGAGGPTVSARLDDGWLVLHRPVAAESSRVAPAASWLRRGGELPGAAKFALGADAQMRLRTDVPLEGDLDTCLRAACGALCSEDPAGGARDQAAATPEATSALEQLCVEAGWQFATRPDGSLAVELPVRDSYAVARLAPFASGAVQVSVDVAHEADAAAPACQEALAIFLLRLNDVVRFARAALSGPENETHVRLEVVFPSQPSAPELDHALAALAVAWDLCSREVEALLHDERVARAYLERSPWSQVPGP